MAVCKGRGDDINTKLNIHSPIPTSFLHVDVTRSQTGDTDWEHKPKSKISYLCGKKENSSTDLKTF